MINDSITFVCTELIVIGRLFSTTFVSRVDLFITGMLTPVVNIFGIYMLSMVYQCIIIVTRVVSHLARSDTPSILELCLTWPALSPPTLFEL